MLKHLINLMSTEKVLKYRAFFVELSFNSFLKNLKSCIYAVFEFMNNGYIFILPGDGNLLKFSL